MRIQVRLPYNDEHIATDGQLPDGTGLPVRINYEGEPIGTVVGWKDQGDGTAQAVLDIELPQSRQDQRLAYGLDAGVFVDDQERVASYERLTGIGVWAEGERPFESFPHLIEDKVQAEGPS